MHSNHLIRFANFTVALALLCGLNVRAADTPTFNDVSTASGVKHVYGGTTDFVVGGGVAAFDCNEDGLPELAFAGGDNPMSLWRNVSQRHADVRFELLDLDGGIIGNTTGVYPFDVDGDSHIDLFVLRFGQNKLLKGHGNCRFSDVTEAIGLPNRQDWSTAFAATWEPGNALPTLFVGNYVDRSRPLQKNGNCDKSYLLRPASAERYSEPQEFEQGACTLSALFVDWANSGRRDLRLANDRQYYDKGIGEQLWQLGPDGLSRYQEQDGWKETRIWGMGIAAADLTGDQRPELAITNMADNRLEILDPDAVNQPRFENHSVRYNTGSQRPYIGDDKRPSTSWHVEFADVNNDAQQDLWIVKGNVDAMENFANFDPDSLLIRNGERFEERGAEAGIAVDTRGRGGVVADLNGDGALDLVVVNREQNARVFQNARAQGVWVGIDPRMDNGNSFSVDAKILVRTPTSLQQQTRRVGGGHAGGSLLPLHFGLGAEERAEVQVVWPDGVRSGWQTLTGGSSHIVRRAKNQ